MKKVDLSEHKDNLFVLYKNSKELMIVGTYCYSIDPKLNKKPTSTKLLVNHRFLVGSENVGYWLTSKVVSIDKVTDSKISFTTLNNKYTLIIKSDKKRKSYV